jgi:hypothetical protein
MIVARGALSPLESNFLRWKYMNKNELYWLAPFICIGLLALNLIRPEPIFPLPPAGSRVFKGGDGLSASIPDNNNDIVMLFGGGGPNSWLELTNAPEYLHKLGGPKDRNYDGNTLSRIYPEIWDDENLWDDPSLGLVNGSGSKGREGLLSLDRKGVYLGGGGYWGMIPLVRRLGFTGIEVPGDLDLYGIDKQYHDYIDYLTLLNTTLMFNDLIHQKDLGEEFIADFIRQLSDLEIDLDSKNIKYRPRLLMMESNFDSWKRVSFWGFISTTQFFSLTGTVNAAKGFPENQEPEVILAIDPDMIITMATDPGDIMKDPRWRGLKAVRDRRVYKQPMWRRFNNEYRYDLGRGLFFAPLTLRWTAEVAHPATMPRKLRQKFKDRFKNFYGYTLTEGALDNYLRIKDNFNSYNYLHLFWRTEKISHHRNTAQ